MLDIMCAIVPYLQPITTLFVGLLVGYVAWQQWRVAQRKLQLDLFDRRYKVFDATRMFLRKISDSAECERSYLDEFNAGTSDAGFLFDQEVVDYLEVIRGRAIEMRKYKPQSTRLPEGDKRSRIEAKETNELEWFVDQLTVMSSIFSPYLSFSHVK